MKRRQFIQILSGVVVSGPLSIRAQSKKIPRVGVLWHAGSAEEEKVPLGAFRQGLENIGYIDGRTVMLEHRFPAEEPERFRSLAAELVDLKIDIFIAVTRPAAIAAQHATSTIPIVFVLVPDPIGSKLVDSLPRPGRNITGLSNMAVDLTTKRVEILKEAVPGLSRVALLVNATDSQSATRFVEAAQAATGPLGLFLQPILVRGAADFEDAFSAMEKNRLQGVVSTVDGLFYNERRRMGRLALERKLPVIAYTRDMVEAGALLSYGPDSAALLRRTAFFVDKILHGASPADLPVEQPTTFQFFVNERVAKALGLAIPPSLLARADEVIE